MPDTPPPSPEPQGGAERIARLTALLGEANVRRMLDNPVTDEQREQIAATVRDAPRTR